MIPFNDLIWDDWNEEHIARHRVTVEEVEEVARSVPFMTRGRSGSYRLIGTTAAGRLLTIFVAPRDGTAYVITARDATRGERRAYERH